MLAKKVSLLKITHLKSGQLNSRLFFIEESPNKFKFVLPAEVRLIITLSSSVPPFQFRVDPSIKFLKMGDA